jgi:hypothetical protein
MDFFFPTFSFATPSTSDVLEQEPAIGDRPVDNGFGGSGGCVIA